MEEEETPLSRCVIRVCSSLSSSLLALSRFFNPSSTSFALLSILSPFRCVLFGSLRASHLLRLLLVPPLHFRERQAHALL